MGDTRVPRTSSSSSPWVEPSGMTHTALTSLGLATLAQDGKVDDVEVEPHA